MARLVGRGIFSERGVFPGELVGRDHETYRTMLRELGERGIFYREQVGVL